MGQEKSVRGESKAGKEAVLAVLVPPPFAKPQQRHRRHRVIGRLSIARLIIIFARPDPSGDPCGPDLVIRGPRNSFLFYATTDYYYRITPLETDSRRV